MKQDQAPTAEIRQLTLDGALAQFDLAAAQKARDAGIDQVQNATSDFWMRNALEAIDVCAGKFNEFTTDDVWKQLGGQPATGQGPDGRVMGAAMKRAQASGLIVPTDRFRNSEQVSCHSRPKRLWQVVKFFSRSVSDES